MVRATGLDLHFLLQLWEKIKALSYEILAKARMKSAAQMKSIDVDEIKSAHISRRSRISSQSDFIHRRWICPVRKDGFS